MAFHDEITLLVLIGVGGMVYAGSILGLFGPRWLKGLVKG
jgi:putative peptidoglycan lipid II flippase